MRKQLDPEQLKEIGRRYRKQLEKQRAMKPKKVHGKKSNG